MTGSPLDSLEAMVDALRPEPRRNVWHVRIATAAALVVGIVIGYAAAGVLR